MGNGKKKLHIILAIGLLTLAFIWWNSMRSVAQSQQESRAVLALLRPLLELFVGSGNVTDKLVRKLAHVAEFAALGIELRLLFAVLAGRYAHSGIYCLFAGLSVAVIDETIQIFSHRGSQVQDVLLDFAACCMGILTCSLCLRLLKGRKKEK